MSALNQTIPQALFTRTATGTQPRAALALRTPRWRQPRCNTLAMVLLISAGMLLALLV
ncbi:MAG: hypothetical protein AAGG11_01305 [Pseudomonadota bacterium]